MKIKQDQYRLLGENVAKLRTDMMKEQLATFKSQLEEFARKHKVLKFLSSSLDFIFNYMIFGSVWFVSLKRNFFFVPLVAE